MFKVGEAFWSCKRPALTTDASRFTECLPHLCSPFRWDRDTYSLLTLMDKERNDADEDEHDAGDALFVVLDKVGTE
jgi:hypothetical protein